MSLLEDLARQFRQSLLSQERASALRMLEAYTVIYGRLRTDLDDLLQILEAARAAGEPVSLARLYQEQRFRLLLEQTEREMRRFAELAGREIAAIQGAAVDQAIDHAEQLILAGFGPAPQSAVTQVTASLLTRLNKGAVQELVGFLSDGSPLSTLLDRYGPEARHAVERALITGIGTGLAPRETARLFRKAASTTLADALRVSRNETMRAARTATYRSYQANQDVLAGWTWHSAADLRTCPVCWSQHGRVFPLDQPMVSHIQCRCTMVPRTRSWAELGFEDIPDRRPTIPNGAEMFRNLPADKQRLILGPAKHAAYVAGELDLSDLVGRKYDGRWGPSLYERSLRSLVGQQAATTYLRRAAD